MRIAVCGTGILGAALAARLAGRAAVTLLDAAPRPGTAATRGSFAWTNSNDKGPRAYHDLNTAGMRAWRALAPQLGGAAWYRPVGNLEWAGDADARAALYARVQRLRSWGYAARLVGRREALGIEPSLSLPEDVTEAAWFPEEGYLLTGPLMERLLARAASHGARLRLGAEGAVRAVEETAQGVAVGTAAGEPVAADLAVLCAGTGTPALAGIPFLLPEAESAALTVTAGPAAGPLGRVVHAPGISLRPAAGRDVHLEDGDAADRPDEHAAALLARARRILPELEKAEVRGHAVCVRPLPVDGHPVVGPLPGAPRRYALVTHSGVTLGARLAELAAREILSGDPSPELAPYRPDRFRAPRDRSAPPRPSSAP
ncbi:hypothetical protein BIV57_14985 [Mangrovactinospora gilvigrisea]|uniref:FAD dependent oxidoreductase domain-containing protein n=1 Tax=Mangrovactinospora gilvigrisea TaxID=1428644 RepID=A0A1J7BDN3_9ACTN|nr:FAD-dependent oxidoreductase [Mangrovactinospora gilvigrisea]OIV36693.1 hypothetical protein BIV57_14985 [Mangrovactinospora gilvigrisea]